MVFSNTIGKPLSDRNSRSSKCCPKMTCCFLIFSSSFFFLFLSFFFLYHIAVAPPTPTAAVPTAPAPTTAPPTNRAVIILDVLELKLPTLARVIKQWNFCQILLVRTYFQGLLRPSVTLRFYIIPFR